MSQKDNAPENGEHKKLLEEHPYDILLIGKNTKEAEGDEKEKLLALLRQEFM